MKTRPNPKIRRTASGLVEIWAPKPPLIGVQAVQRLLLRHVATVCPETKLWVAMIALAMNDAISRNDLQRRRARHFLTSSPELTFWCDLIGLDLSFVREVAARAGYLVDEDALWKPMQPTRSRRTPPGSQALREAAFA